MALTLMETVVPIVAANMGFRLAIRMAENDARTSLLVQVRKIRLRPESTI